ncbi:outer membrane beta-barrel family protein [Fulvivirga maritima]|uniref:outer membrane beta-barrel protein n=1 Tax=Fulvivirga maritima TaxID=2904247 RepID=UPI001F438861|nr:outer membrane beta-barrel protein [Fulvivirga maritima]UII29541.1 outer membrane beta-barrel family protein [Fulvivirga maritima]
MDAGLSKEILDSKGTLALNVRDLLNSRKYRGETFGSNFYQESEFQWRSRQFLLTLLIDLIKEAGLKKTVVAVIMEEMVIIN